MAERPIFFPMSEGSRFVLERKFQFVWHSGFASIQKKKNINALHKAGLAAGFPHLLEVSTKSDIKLGVRLSAFNLKVRRENGAEIPLECAFQGSKVFEKGGPYVELYNFDPREAKRDDRLRSSGKLISFQLDSILFPSEPKTAFYDWIYIRALAHHEKYLRENLLNYDGFTDIEFNPEKSINCQARSCALLVSLLRKGILAEVALSPDKFIEAIKADSYSQPYSRDVNQREFL